MQMNTPPKTVIAEDVEVTGTIKCGSHVQMDGKLNGDLACSGMAIVGTNAVVKGNLSVESVTVLGQINGNIAARDKIELKSTTRLNGDIKARRLTVEDGVTFIGKCEVMPTARPASEEGRTAAPAPAPAHEEAPAEEPADLKGKTGGLFGRR
jgi:cytoskeletal protein CcmA (bactofilin family)